MSKSTIADVCNMINNYGGSQEERDAIIAGVRPVVLNIAYKQLKNPSIKMFYDAEDLEALMYIYLLQCLNAGDLACPSTSYLSKKLYFGLITEMRKERKKLKLYPHITERPFDFIDEIGWHGVTIDNVDMVDFLTDFNSLQIDGVKPATSIRYKRIFYLYVFEHKMAKDIAVIEGVSCFTISMAMETVTRSVCDTYKSDTKAVRGILAKYNQIKHAPKTKVRYGRLIDAVPMDTSLQAR